MYYLTDFKHFVSIFPSFSIQLTPFSINFNFFDPHFYESLDPIGSILFFVCYTQVPTIWWSTPPGLKYFVCQNSHPAMSFLCQDPLQKIYISTNCNVRMMSEKNSSCQCPLYGETGPYHNPEGDLWSQAFTLTDAHLCISIPAWVSGFLLGSVPLSNKGLVLLSEPELGWVVPLLSDSLSPKGVLSSGSPCRLTPSSMLADTLRLVKLLRRLILLPLTVHSLNFSGLSFCPKSAWRVTFRNT